MSIIQEITKKIHLRPQLRLSWLDISLLSLIFLFIVSGISFVPFHGDESAYLILSEDYDRIVKNQEFEKVLFNSDGGNKQNLRLTTGSILAFSIGFMRDITNNDDPIQKWLWGSSWEGNIALGNMPTPRLLNMARACSVAMGATGIILFFLFALKLFSSRLIAWAATLALATQGGVLVNTRRAMQEGPKFLFLILTGYIAALIIKNFRHMHWSRYFLLGAASGLTLAAKQDTSPMLVAIYLALAFIPIWNKGTIQVIFINFLYLGAATILAYAFFLALMPVFWGWWETVFVLIGFALILFQLPFLKKGWSAKVWTFIGCTLIFCMTMISPSLWSKLSVPVVSMVEFRDGLVGAQLASSLNQNLFGDSIFMNRLAFLMTNVVSSRVMYMENATFDILPYHELINNYERSLLSGRTGSLLIDGLILIFALIGGWFLARNFTAEGWFVIFLLFITGTLLFFMIPLLWQRYFLILQIPYLLLAGVGVNQCWLWVKQYSTGTFT